jgi:protease-4
MYDAIDGAAALAGIPGKPAVKEYGKASPWALLFGARDQFDLERLFFRQMKQEMPLTAPLAIPEKW